MKISRRSVLRYTGLTAAWLTLTGCAPTGNASLGGCLPGWMKKVLRVPSSDASSASSSVASSAAPSAASSEAAASSELAASSLPGVEQPEAAFVPEAYWWAFSLAILFGFVLALYRRMT